jgi:hypothetical protein
MAGATMESIKLNDWNAVSDYIDDGWYSNIKASWFEHIIQHQGMYPRDAFTKGQLASKCWLLQNLDCGMIHPNETIAILGSWIGALVEPLINTIECGRVYGLDQDAKSIELSERLNQKHVENSWKYKGVVADVSMLQTCNMEFETGGELISVRPEMVINTSCEHMNNDWFDTADGEQLIVMQSNNSSEFEGHINICEDIEHFKIKYPLTRTLYVGELETPAYTRFMQIGYKK